MLKFLLKVLIFMIMFVIVFSVTHNITPSKVVETIISAARELWYYVRSLFGGNDPTNPYL